MAQKLLEKVSSSRSSSLLLIMLPFLVFVFTYFLASYLLQSKDQVVPNIIGKHLQSAVSILSEHRLALRLLHEREDESLPAGTVLDQLPRPGQKIRPNQSVFVTVSVRQKPLQMPDFWGKKEKEVLEVIAKKGLAVHTVKINTSYPEQMCIGQFPAPGEDIMTKKVIVCFSAGKKTTAIMPSFKGMLIEEMKSVLKSYDAQCTVIHENALADDHHCESCIIKDQYPSAGTVVDTAKPMQIQVQVA